MTTTPEAPATPLAPSAPAGLAATPAPAVTAPPAAGAATAPGPEAFRAAMRHHAKGVAVVTAGEDAPVGFCATSLASVSLDPPMLSFTVGLRASARPAVEAARHVAVHLLAEGQEALARAFARSGAARFGPGTAWHRGSYGLPVLEGVLARFVVAPDHLLPAGDHVLVVGRVTEAEDLSALARPGRPLVHHGGAFAALAHDRITESGAPAVSDATRTPVAEQTSTDKTPGQC